MLSLLDSARAPIVAAYRLVHCGGESARVNSAAHFRCCSHTDQLLTMAPQCPPVSSRPCQPSEQDPSHSRLITIASIVVAFLVLFPRADPRRQTVTRCSGTPTRQLLVPRFRFDVPPDVQTMFKRNALRRMHASKQANRCANAAASRPHSRFDVHPTFKRASKQANRRTHARTHAGGVWLHLPPINSASDSEA